MIEGTGIWINGNGNGANAPYAETKFKGTKAWVIGTIDQKHGPADVYIDGKKLHRLIHILQQESWDRFYMKRIR